MKHFLGLLALVLILAACESNSVSGNAKIEDYELIAVFAYGGDTFNPVRTAICYSENLESYRLCPGDDSSGSLVFNTLGSEIDWNSSCRRQDLIGVYSYGEKGLGSDSDHTYVVCENDGRIFSWELKEVG